MSKPYINWEERKVVGKSGKVYKICPEILSSARYVHFEIRSMTEAFKTNLDGILMTLQGIEDELTKGKLNSAGNIFNALTKLRDFKKGLVAYQEYKRTPSIEFCALFCIEDGEDVSRFDEDQIRSKWDDWKEIPDQDFFLLSLQVKVSSSKNYRDLIKAANVDMNNLTPAN